MELILQRTHPAGKLAGVTAVVAFHALIVLAFMQGLAQHRIAFPPPAVDPVTILPPAPPPPRTELPTLKSTTFTPAQVQPVMTELPPVVFDTITATAVEATNVASSGPSIAAVSEPGTVSASVGAACPNAQGVRSSLRYPVQARRDGLQGEVVARFLVAANGEIRNIAILSSSNRAFNNTVINAVKQFNCIGQGRDVAVEVPFSFKLD